MGRPLEFPLIVPWIRLDQDAKAEEEAALARAKAPWLAGYTLFGGDAEQVRRLTDRLRDAAGRPIFVASDMERGAGQQVKGLRVLPDAAIWGAAATPSEAFAYGALTAADARSVGVDVLFAPVLDVRSEPTNPIVGNRAFAWDSDRVGLMGAAFVDGALSLGCAPTAKHYPGHGATTADSHDALPIVDLPADLLRSRDRSPFELAIIAGCPALMTAHVAYPSLDPSRTIATFSKPILDDLRAIKRPRREKFPSDLVVFTDALLMTGAAIAGGETAAARASLLAGCDAMLIPTSPEQLAAELMDGASQALLAAADLSARRLRDFAKGIADLPIEPSDSTDRLDVVPARVADRAVKLSGGHSIETLLPDDTLVIVDDDATPDRGRVLAERAERAGVEAIVVRMRDGKPDPRVPADCKPAAVVLMASVRAWKGTSSASVEGQRLAESLANRDSERCRMIALTPRRLPVFAIHIPGTGPDVEAALADRFFG